MSLHKINVGVHKNKKPNRVGRGLGSGQGKTAAKGHKGQRSRAGWSQPAVFQGGMSPLVRRVPKRGFHNAFGLTVGAVNVGDLEVAFESGAEVTLEKLREKDLLKGRYDEIKILGDGDLTKKLKIVAHRFSASAKEKIEKAGGEMVVLVRAIPVEEKKKVARAANKALRDARRAKDAARAKK